jgi:prepilin-type N-terminal cleavage/methylation domain-containing protein
MVYKDNSTIYNLPPTTYQKGFTIVELLVVIVVIGILAAITIVSYTGISQRATVASLQSDLTNASRQLKLYQVTASGYPANLSDLNAGRGLTFSAGTTNSYIYNNNASPQIFCLTLSKGGIAYKINNDGAYSNGECQTAGIVTDGLVMNFDSANLVSYSGAGTAMTDLSGIGNHGTLLNGVGYSNLNQGSMVFDGVNDKIQTNYAPQLGDFTVSIWYKDNGSGVHGRLIDKSYAGGFWLGRNSGLADSWGGGIREGSSPYGIYLTLTDGNWNYLTSVRQGTTHTLYGNGISNTVSNTVSSSPLDATSIAIGGWSTPGTQWFKGNIGVVFVYNRALSTSEIQQNFDALKGRYGL